MPTCWSLLPPGPRMRRRAVIGGLRSLPPAAVDRHRGIELCPAACGCASSKRPDLHQQVLARVGSAAGEALTASLMRTPLQVTIMSLLLRTGGRAAPQDRYGLFEAYYSTLYDREVGKATDVARLLNENRGHVDHLHERVGMILQTRAEGRGSADAALPSDELEQLAVARLTSEEVTEAQASGLAARLVKAATDRLVLLVAPDRCNRRVRDPKPSRADGGAGDYQGCTGRRRRPTASPRTVRALAQHVVVRGQPYLCGKRNSINDTASSACSRRSTARAYSAC